MFEGEVPMQRTDLNITLFLRKVVVVVMILILLTVTLLVLGCMTARFQADYMFRL